MLCSTTLADSPHLYQQTIELIEQEFHYSPHQHFDIDFYPLMNPLNHHNCHLLVEEKLVIAHLAVLPRDLTFRKISSPVLLIGGIAVRKEYQGRGIFKKFMSKLLSSFQEKYSFMLLWSDLESLYKKFDFYECGGVIQTGGELAVEASLPDRFKKVCYKDLTSEQLSSIKQNYQNNIEKKYLTLKRTPLIWDSLAAISSSSLYLIYNQKEEICGHFFSGKGQDLTGIIHELVINDQEHDDIISILSKYRLWLPQSYNSQFKKEDILFCALFKICNEDLFSDFISNISRNKVQINCLSLTHVEFSLNNKNYSLNKNEFLKSLFGPSITKEFEGIFPQVLISGLDSI